MHKFYHFLGLAPSELIFQEGGWYLRCIKCKRETFFSPYDRL